MEPKVIIGEKNYLAHGSGKLAAESVQQYSKLSNNLSLQFIETPGAGNSWTVNPFVTFQIPFACILKKVYCSIICVDNAGLYKELGSFNIRITNGARPENSFVSAPTFSGTGVGSVRNTYLFRSNQKFVDVDLKDTKIFFSSNDSVQIAASAFPITAFAGTESITINLNLFLEQQ